MNLIESIVGKILPKSQAQNANAARPSPLLPSEQSIGGGVGQTDVEEILTAMARDRSDKLNWRTSIVDLMKLLDMDSSLSARKQLARELDYSGDPNDSAAMNIWLHRRVMQRLAENGGKVPEDLKH